MWEERSVRVDERQDLTPHRDGSQYRIVYGKEGGRSDRNRERSKSFTSSSTL